ncbi:hypothetical protein [Streptomyces sp. TS71-3]|uniref:hypothetical protein n=1 Tax=Streptomyces sp. TS71-3 TaxID=2733862 RepID=UPI001B0E057C|nr:hypothetical protein [Streptomyces sp. TS71-3]GHJ37392.1 hypothetical protein Sm713_30010 [Streptomyces sp. TS71-3]
MAEELLGSREDVPAVRHERPAEPAERTERTERTENATVAVAWWLDAQDSLPYRLSATGPWGTAEARGHDLWAALAQVRGVLEADGWLLAVNAARPDVLQSGMLRDSGSTRAYRVRTGERASQDSMVDLFDAADADAVLTVAAQSEAHARWRASVRSRGAGR